MPSVQLTIKMLCLYDKETLTALCSVVKHEGSGYKEVKGETQNVVEYFSLLLDCSVRFLLLLSHGFKSNVRQNRPDLASTQEHESHTVTKTGSEYNIKQHNNFLGKQNLLGQRNTFVIEKELNGILSGPCDGRKTLSGKQ